jgi:hypothetical protein
VARRITCEEHSVSIDEPVPAGAAPAGAAHIPALPPPTPNAPAAPPPPATPRIHRRRDEGFGGDLESKYAWLSTPGDAQEVEADELAQRLLSGWDLSASEDQAAPPRPLDHFGTQSAQPLPSDVPASVHMALSSPGESLDTRIAARMAQSFRVDVSQVRVHRDAAAAASARALQAHAYTFGRHIVFAEGRYAPGTAAGRDLFAHELAHGVQHARAQRIFRQEVAQKIGPTAVVVAAASFDDAATKFADLLKTNGVSEPARIVVVNGPNLRVYDETGKPVTTQFFHLKTPAHLPVGVYRSIDQSTALHPILQGPDGRYGTGKALQSKGAGINFSRDIDDLESYKRALQGGKHVYYVSPESTAVGATAAAPPPQPIENLPEFMQFQGKTPANLPAWDSAVIPLTPQVATVNSMGSFRCIVDKNQGVSTLDRVTNLMQPTSFHWQVLKLDEKLHVKETETSTRWDAAKEGYNRRLRNLEADRKTLQGDPKKQSIPESVVRAAIADQVTNARTILAMTGQTVVSFIDALTGGPNQLTTEDTVDIPFKEQGDFFVRCLASQVVPKDAKWRRATSVSGVMVSVYDIQDVAKESLPTAQNLQQQAQQSLASVQDELASIDTQLADPGIEPDKKQELSVRQHFLGLKVTYLKELDAAGTAPDARKTAQLNFTRAQIAYLKSDRFPTGAKYSELRTKLLGQLEKEEKELAAGLETLANKLKDYDPAIKSTGLMPAALVDEYTGAASQLVFAVGERISVNVDELEVVIADVTGSKGRIFNGRGAGFRGAGRHDAWLNALDDLRKNLNRGRGYLSYQVPDLYKNYAGDTPNPMQLQLSVGAQVKEMVDDTAHVMTLAAIMAAPFTGGASLGILAVLAPIQAASSLYNLVNRSLYGDLELDSEAVFDFINVATLGLGKISEAGGMASKTMRIVATSSRVAIRLLTAGQYILITYNTYTALTQQDDPNEDPRIGRKRRLMALLNLMEAAAIPVSEKLWSEARGPAAQATPEEIRPGTRLPDQGGGTGETKIPGTKPGIEQRAAGETAGARPAAGEKAASLSERQSKAVPKELQKSTRVDPNLGRDARVVYEMGPDGLISRVELHIGREASAADIAAHVEVANLMLKYQGLGGRLRRLRDAFANLLSGPESQRPQVGSRAWEARLELIKLDRMMQQRQSQLALYANRFTGAGTVDPAFAAKRDPALETQLYQDLDSLQQQFDEHAAVLNAIDLGLEQGRGYVAVEGLSEGETQRKSKGYPEAEEGYYWRLRKGELEYVATGGRRKMYYDETRHDFVPDDRPVKEERFEGDVDRRQAFRELGGYDADTSLGSFVKVLLDLGIVKSRAEVIREMQPPANRTQRTVRHNLKEAFRERIVDRITSESYLKKTQRYKEVLEQSKSAEQALRAAGMEELSNISNTLEPEDQGSFGERVYARLFGTARSWEHVEVSRGELAKAKGVPVEEVETGRAIDRMDGNTGRELKNVTTRLGPRERSQIDDMVSMVDKKVTHNGSARTVKEVAVAFLNPEGGARNASLAYEILTTHGEEVPLTFEFHASDGSVVKVNYANRDVLTRPDFATRLGAPTRSGGKTP